MHKYLLFIGAIVLVLAAVWLFLISGNSTGYSGPDKALGLFQPEAAEAAPPPKPQPKPPTPQSPYPLPVLMPFPGLSVDGGTREGTAPDVPPPDEPAVEDDSAAEVNEDGAPVPISPPVASAPEQPQPTPVEPSAPAAVIAAPKPEPTPVPIVAPQEPPAPKPVPPAPRAGYCDASNTFYDLTVEQEITDPEWAAKGPWREADVNPETGAIYCKSAEPKPTQKPLGVVEFDLERSDGAALCGRYVALRFYPDGGGQSFLGYRTTCTTTALTLAKSGNVCPVVRAARGLSPLTPACVRGRKGTQMIALQANH